MALLREIVRQAILAASSHNTQPWKFRLDQRSIVILPDLSRRTPVVDPDDHHLFVSLGCATENLVHAALANGLRADVAIAGDHIYVGLERARPVQSPLFGAIASRQCSRSVYDGRALAAGELRQLEATARGDNIDVLVIMFPPRDAILCEHRNGFARMLGHASRVCSTGRRPARLQTCPANAGQVPLLTIVGSAGMAFGIAAGVGGFEIRTQFVDPALPLDEGGRIVGLRNWDVRRFFVAVIIGVFPALKITGRGLLTRLRSASAGGGGYRFGGVWTAVITAQVAVTVMFPATAFFFHRGVIAGQTRDVGFPSKEYLSARLEMDDGIGTPAATVEKPRRQLAAEPGVTGITFADRLPGMLHAGGRFDVEGDDAAPTSGYNVRSRPSMPTSSAH